MDSQPKIDILRDRFASDPDSRAFVPLAEELRRLGRLEEALTLLEAELDKHPHFSSGMVVLGRTLMDAGSWERARQVLLQVREMDTDNPLILNLLLEDAGRRGAWHEAADILTELIRLEPDNVHWTRLREKMGKVSTPEPEPEPSRATDFETEPSAAVKEEAQTPQELAALATMTLVDIYLDQGYRQKALATLEVMARHDPANLAVQERLQGLANEASKDSGDKQDLDRALASLDETLDVSTAKEEQKSQFLEWLSRIREEEEGD